MTEALSLADKQKLTRGPSMNDKLSPDKIKELRKLNLELQELLEKGLKICRGEKVE